MVCGGLFVTLNLMHTYAAADELPSYALRKRIRKGSCTVKRSKHPEWVLFGTLSDG